MIATSFARQTPLTPRLLVAMVLVLGGCAASHATAGFDKEVHGINCSGADRTGPVRGSGRRTCGGAATTLARGAVRTA